MTERIVVDRDSVDSYIWESVCKGWRLLQSPALAVIQEQVPPGAGEVLHFHSRAQQFFYVLAGVATMVFDDESIRFGPGQGLQVPAGTRHRFVNEGEDPVDFLVISAPSTAEDRVNLP